MIARIEGIIKFKGMQFVVIDTGGVGYKIFISAETLRKIPKLEERIALWTHTHLREDTIELYGFLSYAELEFFRQLIQISGIGPKSALGVLAVGPIDNLKKAIAAGETAYLTKVSGIGRKLAEKIVVELRDKLASIGIDTESGTFTAEGEALDALRGLGYSLQESRVALQKVSKDKKSTEEMIKEALKNVRGK